MLEKADVSQTGLSICFRFRFGTHAECSFRCRSCESARVSPDFPAKSILPTTNANVSLARFVAPFARQGAKESIYRPLTVIDDRC